MPFDNEDLKRLKDIARKDNYAEDDVAVDAAIWALNRIPALLARLECAERLLGSSTLHHAGVCDLVEYPDEPNLSCSCESEKLEKEWLQSKGETTE